MNPADLVQGSPEWKAYKCGRVGASCIADLMARTKTGWGASRANLMADLIAERLTGVAAEGYTNAAMQHGVETEPLACEAYEFYRDVELKKVGFVDHPSIPMTGASPDRLAGDDGLVEVKCPNTATHIDTLISDEVDGKYLKQIQWQLACTGRKWCDFVSFDNRLPERLRLFVKRIHRDDQVIAELEKQVREFLADLDKKIAALNTLTLKEAA